MQAFFLVSGFYMSLILNEKYNIDARGDGCFTATDFLEYIQYIGP